MARAYDDSATQYDQALLTYDALKPVFGFGAAIYATRTKTFNFGATLVRAKTFSFGAEIIDTRGTYRGVKTTTERNALTYKQAKDTAIVTDDSGDQPQHYYTGATWMTAGAQHASSEAGVNRYRTAPTTAGYKADMGDSTYPFRYWDGTTSLFYVDNAGGVYASSITITQKDTSTVGLTIQSAGAGFGSSLLSVRNASGITALNIPNAADKLNMGGVDITIRATSGGSILTTLAAAGYAELTEITAPSAGAVDTVRIYAEDNGAGKTRLMARFNTGLAQQIAIQP